MRSCFKLNKDDIVELEITAMTSEGSGVGRHGQMAVFVPHAAVGDKAEVKIEKVEKRYALGKLLSVLEPSADRIDTACPAFGRCGGCTYQHISYASELLLKEQRVRDALVRIGGLVLKVSPIIGADKTQSYRNKAEYQVAQAKDGTTCAGFYERATHAVAPCQRCLIQSEKADKVRDIIISFMDDYQIRPYSKETGQGVVRHILVRTSSVGQIMVVIVIKGAALPHGAKLVELLVTSLPEIKSIGVSNKQSNSKVILGEKTKYLLGSGMLDDELLGLKFQISARSFYQINQSQCERLYSLALEKADVKEDEVCLDLYSGVGTITCLLAQRAKKAIGVEIERQAVENARKNAALNDLTNVEFICASAQQAVAKIQREGTHIDVLTVNPPRGGLEPTLIDAIAIIGPKRLVYISCDPATLARDLKLMKEEGYLADEVTPVDMFPRTPHVETVVLMSRVDK